MHERPASQRRRRRDETAAVPERAQAPPEFQPGLDPQRILALQRTAGNQAVTRALQRKPIYRGMQADAPNGTRPLLGNDSGFQLGVRSGEFKLDNDGKVLPGSGGMSTSSVRNKVPDFTASKAYAFGSHATTDQAKQPFRWVWEFDDANLPDGVQVRNDHGNHVMVEAAESMTPDELRTKVQGTQGDWARSDPP